jgi:hypothetical protein
MHHGFSWWYIGDSLQADRRFHVCRRGGGTGGNHAGQADEGGGEMDPGKGLYKSQKVMEEGGKA